MAELDGGVLEPGEVLDGKYRIVRQLAAGAMGVVYVAKHTTLGRNVAVKTLRRELVNDPEIAARFEQEAMAASAIGHANIVDVFDLGRTRDGGLYMVMELLDGRSLADLLDEEPLLPVPRALDLMTQVLSALAAAHKHAIVHRDLKPENIFVLETEDRPSFVKLLDFGISKVLGGPAAISGRALKGTAYGTVMGTPEYMSPEQARGRNEAVDARTDVYAAGVVLYEMLCGRTPYQGDNYNAVMSAIVVGDYPPPRSIRPSLPAPLEELIVKAMAYERSKRWQSAGAMREAVLLLLRQLPGAAMAAPSAEAVAAAVEARQSAAVSATLPSLVVVPPSAPPATVTLKNEDVPSLDLSLDVPPEVPDAPPLEPLSLQLTTIDGEEDDEPPGPSLSLATDPEPASAAPAPARAPAPAPVPAAAPAPAPAPPRPSSLREDEPLELASEPVKPTRSSGSHAPARPHIAPLELDHAPRAARGTPRHPDLYEAAPSPTPRRAFVGVVLLLVLGAAGAVGYKLIHKGGTGENADAAVNLTLMPDNAELRLDGRAVGQRNLPLASGSSHTLTLTAPGYVTRKVIVVVHEGPQDVSLRLAHQLLEQTPREVYAPERPAVAHYADPVSDVDDAFGKLDSYRACFPLSEQLRDSRDHFLQTLHSQPRRPELQTVSEAAIRVCTDRIQRAGALHPTIEPVETAATQYAKFLNALVPVVRAALVVDADDDPRIPVLVRRFDELIPLDETLRRELRVARAAYEAAELLQIREEGKVLPWHMRRFALAAQAWVRALQARVPVDALVAARAKEAQAAYQEFAQHAELDVDDAAAIAGLAPFQKAAAAFAELLHGHPARDAVLEAANGLVRAFNATTVN